MTTEELIKQARARARSLSGIKGAFAQGPNEIANIINKLCDELESHQNCFTFKHKGRGVPMEIDDD